MGSNKAALALFLNEEQVIKDVTYFPKIDLSDKRFKVSPFYINALSGG